MFILSLTGTLPTPDLNDYANYVVKPELARVPGAGTIEVLASDTREIEVILDPAQADRRRADGRRRLRRAQGAEHRPAGRPLRGIGPAAPGARVRALEERRRDRAARR